VGLISGASIIVAFIKSNRLKMRAVHTATMATYSTYHDPFQSRVFTGGLIAFIIIATRRGRNFRAIWVVFFQNEVMYACVNIPLFHRN